MRFGDRSDAELIELAKAGWAPAFAVLVHRYAPLVHAARADAADPTGAVTQVFVQAMRELADRDPGAPVAPWLLGLAGARATPPTPTALTDDELDAIWGELDRRWPDGRPPARPLPWRRAAAVVGLAVLAGLVPAIVLGVDGNGGVEEPTELRAVPLPDERTEVVEEEPEDDAPEFSFPTTPEEQEPAPEPEPEPQPTEPAREESEPTPQQEPEQQDETEEPTGEPDDDAPDGDGDDEAGDDGLLGGVLDGDEDDAEDDAEHDDGSGSQQGGDGESATDGGGDPDAGQTTTDDAEGT